MPDIDPAALSRPSVSLSTPILSTKTLASTIVTTPKASKIPARIDLEPLYTALKSAIGSEQWLVYKESTTEFLIGRLNQIEYSQRIDPILVGPEKEHLHNQLIAAIYGNVTREVPDAGLAPWVSANDKPATGGGSKAVSGDAAERRLKGHVMQLPARDRRRIKDLVHNDWDPFESITNVFLETQPQRKQSTIMDATPSAGAGINNMNFDLEIRKRFAQPLAIESGEFPDVGMISGRMLPMCYEVGLHGGHTAEAPHFMSVAVETFIKEALTEVFSRTRSNGPGETGSGGFSIGINWIHTNKYRKQLRREEEAAQRGEILRDKSGLLPIESKAAGERGALGIADLRLALQIGHSGMTQFPVLTRQLLNGWREGEAESWEDYTWVDGRRPQPYVEEHHAAGVNGDKNHAVANGYPEAMDIDNEIVWDGADDQDLTMLDGVLDSCLAVVS